MVRRSSEFGCMFVRSGKERVAARKASPADGQWPGIQGPGFDWVSVLGSSSMYRNICSLQQQNAF
jgi:hypothetical protein